MARMLGRSRSLRILKGGHKETQQEESQRPTPLPAHSQVDLERLKAATPVSRPDVGRVETPDMLQRPKTSGGPSDRGKLFHKKTAPVTPLSSEDQAFVFPFSSPTKSTSVLYAAEVTEDREGIIGIALGSPTMTSHPNWNTTPRSTDFVTNNTGTFTQITSNNPSHYELPDAIGSRQDAQKPKLSRWKSLFKKTAPPPPQEKASFYQLAQAVTPARADSHHDDESLDSRLQQEEEDPRAVSPPTFRPEIRESRKLPKGQAQPPTETRPRALTFEVNPINKRNTTLQRSASSPKPPPKDLPTNSPTVPQLVVSGGGLSNGSPRTNGEMPLLDVNIPDVKMERYSVMFSSLLQPNSSRSSSLLVRRQGNPDRLKPLNELSAKNGENGSRNGSLKPPQRRATSPSLPPKSPSAHLSLFPAPSNSSRAPSPRAVSVNRPRPLQRSKTAPATSPNRQSFPKSVEGDAKDASEEIKNTSVELPDTGSGMKTQLLTPTPSSRHSFDSDSEEITIVVARSAPGQAQPWRPRVEDNEPEWEIVSKPANPVQHAITKRSALSSHPSSAPLDPPSRADQHPNTKPQTQLSPTPRSADVASESRREGKLEAQATVGIARSVSVSRTSPNKPDLLRPTLVKRATDREERLVDKKPLTPTLVELKNRKSQRVQLVDA